jgi:hypothetical protein
MTERSDKMPVIGRLDEQVDALLISPLKRRRTPDEEARDESKTPANADEDHDTESPDERRAGDASLPVWLL